MGTSGRTGCKVESGKGGGGGDEGEWRRRMKGPDSGRAEEWKGSRVEEDEEWKGVKSGRG